MLHTTKAHDGPMLGKPQKKKAMTAFFSSNSN